MARSKKAPSKNKKQNTRKSKGSIDFRTRLETFLKSEDFKTICGIASFLLAAFLLVSSVSYFVNIGGIDSTDRRNWLGVMGGWISRHVITGTFGIASFGFPFLLMVLGFKLLRKDILPWGKTCFASFFWMAWLSMMVGYFLVVKESESDFLAGSFGYMLSGWLNEMLKVFTPILLSFLAVAMLIGFHHISLPKREESEDAYSDDPEPVEDEPEEELEKKPSLITRFQGMMAQRKENKALERAQARAEKKRKEEEMLRAQEAEEFRKRQEAEQLEREQAAQRDQNLQVASTVDPEQQVAPQEEVPEEEVPSTEQITFDINDEYTRLTQKFQPTATQDVDFTVVDTQASSSEENPLASEASEFIDPETGEALADDDYRRHFGVDDPYDPKLELRDFQMPDVSLLEDYEVRNEKVTQEELIANKNKIVETLRNYNIEIVGITATPGPTVTLYEIKPAPGVRISKIKNLEDDIALSLAALGIRIIAPIPGKGTVGIEVPNTKPQVVSMRNMLSSDAFVNNTKYELPIAFGKTISNEPFVTDLAKMPHLLMAGATGTGKSVGLNAVIASLLYKKHPAELKFVMVDPKKVELSLYSKIERHYLAKLPDSDEAIITDVKKVVRTLNSLCIEMDQRYDLLKMAHVRNIKEYNEKFIKRCLNPENGHHFMPYIVLVVDEFADLIMTAGKEVELPIARLAQLARAVGIHLIIATQRPTTNIITGTIKANFPARVAFRVTSAIDSRTILDTGGANQLIGRGDMLISLAGSDLVRIQCALIETKECDAIAEFVGEQRGYPDGFLLPEYLDENDEPTKDFDPKQKDEMFNDAARLVVASQFGSTSLLQRKLSLGYNRAGRIIDQLEAAGIVGPYAGSKARDVLIKDEVELEEILRNL